MKNYDYLIVGAGFAGSTLANLIATQLNLKVLVIDKRNHIAGNAYDSYNKQGVLIHNYGPHIFHTNHKKVWDFLSTFTQWYYYQHYVLSFVDGLYVPIPININTINTLNGTNYNSENIDSFFNKVKVNIENIETSEDIVLSSIGENLYNKLFKNYTKKQWGVYPSELDKSVTARIPVRYNYDPRYFTDKYQAIPSQGYTHMFSNMLKHKNIDVSLNTNFNDVKNKILYKKLIYTGPIDEFFDYKYGTLPYRSLKFEFESFNQEYYQKAPVINYPNDYDFTRVTEYKYLTGQKHNFTTISREYSSSSGTPYYPIPNKDNFALFKKYKQEADSLKNTIFIGRLAEYKYYNMDNVVIRALELFESIKHEYHNAN